MHHALRISAGALVATGLMLCSSTPATPARDAAARPATSAPCHDMRSMSAADMQKWVNDFYTTHRKVGVPSLAAAADTFLVDNFFFDTDHSIATQVDTARIAVGQTILWTLVAGSHTVTNGRDSSDPAAGLLFDQPIDPSHTSFSFRFDGRGRYPFFCRPHQSFQMLGVVIVGTPTDVRPIDSAVESSGFLGAPVPNPSHGDVVVQFALRTAGRARLEVFDVMGRQIAVPFERDLGTGRWTATWDGRTTAGRAAGAGVYWLRLQVPERVETRRLVLAH